ncbi:MAG: hypothetical protein WBV45_05695, partial [Lutimonas sp.]
MNKYNRSKGPGFPFFLFALSLLLSFAERGISQGTQDDLLTRLMQEQGTAFQSVLTNPERYRVQILYTQIDRDQKNKPRFKSYTFGVSPDTYFYPASSIKIFGATLSLEKFNALNIKNLNKDTFVKIDSSYSGQTAVLLDSTSPSEKPSFGHYIKKLLVLS